MVVKGVPLLHVYFEFFYHVPLVFLLLYKLQLVQN